MGPAARRSEGCNFGPGYLPCPTRGTDEARLALETVPRGLSHLCTVTTPCNSPDGKKRAESSPSASAARRVSLQHLQHRQALCHVGETTLMYFGLSLLTSVLHGAAGVVAEASSSSGNTHNLFFQTSTKCEPPAPRACSKGFFRSRSTSPMQTKQEQNEEGGSSTARGSRPQGAALGTRCPAQVPGVLAELQLHQHCRCGAWEPAPGPGFQHVI